MCYGIKGRLDHSATIYVYLNVFSDPIISKHFNEGIYQFEIGNEPMRVTLIAEPDDENLNPIVESKVLTVNLKEK